MLTIEKCRKIIKVKNQEPADAEVEIMRDQLYILANLVVDKINSAAVSSKGVKISPSMSQELTSSPLHTGAPADVKKQVISMPDTDTPEVD